MTKKLLNLTVLMLLAAVPAMVSCSDDDGPDKPDTTSTPDNENPGEPRSISNEEFQEKVMGKIWIPSQEHFEMTDHVRGDGTIDNENYPALSGGIFERGFYFEAGDYYYYYGNPGMGLPNPSIYDISGYAFDETTGRAHYRVSAPWSDYLNGDDTIFYIESVTDDLLVIHNDYGWETSDDYDNKSASPEKSYTKRYYKAMTTMDVETWRSKFDLHTDKR